MIRTLIRKHQCRRPAPGQALAEFAIVAPVLILVFFGIIQFGLIFWSQNTLTQIARDTGRWAASQQDCADINAITTTANQIAGASSLLGYAAGEWTGSASDTASNNEVVVSWRTVNGTCPPQNNTQVSFVRITVNHQIPIFFPFIPGSGNLSTAAEFRMEPEPQ